MHWCLWLSLWSQTSAVNPSLREGLEQWKSGKLESAEESLRVAIQESPNSGADAYYYLGVVRFRLRRLASAQEALEKAVRMAPKRADVWKALGVVHAAQLQYRSAQEPFRRACELDRWEADACYYLGRNYYATGQFEAALSAYETALAVDRHPIRVHAGMALGLEALGRAPEAESRYRLALTSPGQFAPDQNPHVDFGAFLLRQARVLEARRQLEQAVQAFPSSARARFELAKVLLADNCFQLAAAQLERALDLDPSYRAAHRLLSKAYYRLGRLEDALRAAELGKEVAGSSR